VQSDGTAEHPLPIDARLIANRTLSLCTPQAWNEARLRVCSVQESPLPAMVLASTDGYANSYATDEDFLRIGIDYLQSIRKEGFDRVIAHLPLILTETSHRGSGDDITLGIMYLEDVSSVRSTIALHAPGIQDSTAKPLHSFRQHSLWIWIPPFLLLVIAASFSTLKQFSSQLPPQISYPISPSPRSSTQQNPVRQRRNQSLLAKPVSPPSSPKKILD
jgi:hypothetical protein